MKYSILLCSRVVVQRLEDSVEGLLLTGCLVEVTLTQLVVVIDRLNWTKDVMNSTAPSSPDLDSLCFRRNAMILVVSPRKGNVGCKNISPV
jgi:hypothetical protein